MSTLILANREPSQTPTDRARHAADRNRRRRQAGFTLVELLVVLVILGLLASLAVPQVLQYLSKAKTDTASVVIQNIGSALDLYRLDVGHFPTQEEGLAALVERPGDSAKWFGPYLKSRDMLVDPWGNPYHYRVPGESGPYDIFSLGADNQEGGEGEDGDIHSR